MFNKSTKEGHNAPLLSSLEKIELDKQSLYAKLQDKKIVLTEAMRRAIDARPELSRQILILVNRMVASKIEASLIHIDKLFSVVSIGSFSLFLEGITSIKDNPSFICLLELLYAYPQASPSLITLASTLKESYFDIPALAIKLEAASPIPINHFQILISLLEDLVEYKEFYLNIVDELLIIQNFLVETQKGIRLLNKASLLSVSGLLDLYLEVVKITPANALSIAKTFILIKDLSWFNYYDKDYKDYLLPCSAINNGAFLFLSQLAKTKKLKEKNYLLVRDNADFFSNTDITESLKKIPFLSTLAQEEIDALLKELEDYSYNNQRQVKTFS